MAEKNAAAVELGRLGGVKGGRARAEKLPAWRRQEIARQAAAARWKKELFPVDVRRRLEIERHRKAMADLDAEERATSQRDPSYARCPESNSPLRPE